MLIKGRNAPKNAGHGDTDSTAVLPAAGKKATHSKFPAKSGDQSWLARCARTRQSCVALC